MADRLLVLVLYPSVVSGPLDELRIDKVYQLSQGDDPSGIPTGDFERNGRLYYLLDMVRKDEVGVDTPLSRGGPRCWRYSFQSLPLVGVRIDTFSPRPSYSVRSFSVAAWPGAVFSPQCAPWPC